MFLGLGLVADSATASIARVDLGNGGSLTRSFWSNLTSPNVGASTNLLNLNSGATLPWNLGVSRPFTSIITSGTSTPGSSIGFPASATSDGFYANALPFNGVTNSAPQLTFSGLNPSETYDFKLFASRTGVADNRSASYILGGANSVSGTLNASNNSNNMLYLPGVRPDSGGRVRLDLYAAYNNNSPSKFVYLNALEIVDRGNTPLPQPTGRKNILFYGNSFTLQYDVPGTLAKLATSSNRTEPYVVRSLLEAQNLDYHIQNTRNNPAANVQALPSGQQFDFVVMQEESLKPTRLGNPADFKNDAVTLTQLVRDRSPGVTPILFETWARKPGSGVYSNSFANPSDMQSDLRSSYYGAQAQINAAIGSGRTEVAPVGDVWESTGYNNLHADYDDKHANARGALLASLTLYAQIYDDSVSDISWNSVSWWAAGRGIDAGQWSELTRVVDTKVFGFARAVSLVPEPAMLLSVAVAGVAILRRSRRI